MKRTMITVFALLVLAISQVSVAFARPTDREIELSEIGLQAAATATIYPLSPMTPQVALDQAVKEMRRSSEVFQSGNGQLEEDGRRGAR